MGEACALEESLVLFSCKEALFGRRLTRQLDNRRRMLVGPIERGTENAKLAVDGIVTDPCGAALRDIGAGETSIDLIGTIMSKEWAEAFPVFFGDGVAASAL